MLVINPALHDSMPIKVSIQGLRATSYLILVSFR